MIVLVATQVFLLILFILLIAKSHVKATQGKALIRTGFGGPRVTIDTGIFVIPILHKVEEIDISLKTIQLSEVIQTSDNQLVEIQADFYIRIYNTKETIIKVAQTIGCERTSNQEALEELFKSRFIDATKAVTAQFRLEDLRHERETFKNHILNTIGQDLNGYQLDDCAILNIKKAHQPNFKEIAFVLLDDERPLEKGEKVYVVDKINDGKSYIVRRI